MKYLLTVGGRIFPNTSSLLRLSAGRKAQPVREYIIDSMELAALEGLYVGPEMDSTYNLSQEYRWDLLHKLSRQAGSPPQGLLSEFVRNKILIPFPNSYFFHNSDGNLIYIMQGDSPSLLSTRRNSALKNTLIRGHEVVTLQSGDKLSYMPLESTLHPFERYVHITKKK